MSSDRRQLLAYEIVRLTQNGHSQRSISLSLGIGRKTIRRILLEQAERRIAGESAVERIVGRARVPKGSMLDPFDGVMRSWLKTYPNLTAVRCLEKLQDEGFEGQYTIVREQLNRLRKEITPEPPAVVVHMTPGQRSEFDWSPYKLAEDLEVNTWNATLCWSRGGFLKGANDSKQTTIMSMLRRSFEEWRGVTHECMTDSMPGVVDRWECDEPVINSRFVDFAAYYRFKILIAPRACPKFKARAERRFRYHEENLLNGRTITSFQQYNELLDWWLREKAMRRPHPETKREIWQMVEEERAYLLPLPAKPYDTRDVFVRVVSPTGHVHHETNQYSIPDGHIGDRVYVCVDLERVEICDKRALHLIEHERLPNGAGIQLPQLGSASRRPRYDVDSLIDRICDWDERAEEFARGVKKARRYAGPQLMQLINLQLDWSLDDIVAAMTHALEYRCFEVQAVTRILQARFTPRRFEAAIAESTRQQIQEVMKTHPIHQRSLSCYESLNKGDRQASVIGEVQNDQA